MYPKLPASGWGFFPKLEASGTSWDGEAPASSHFFQKKIQREEKKNDQANLLMVNEKKDFPAD